MIKNFVVGLSCFICILLSTSAMAERQKIGLVLGGGGARGAAHIGVLKVIERERIPIDYIAGTSMGAIVGSLYASGRSAAEIEEIVQSIDWQDALTDTGPRSEHSIRSKKNDVEFAISVEAGLRGGKLKTPTGLLQGQRLELLLRRLLIDAQYEDSFDDLPIPFRAVATNLATMKPVVLDRGDLATAVRASMSVPGFFEPVRFEDTLLVDGGLFDNVPVHVAKDMGADILIVVDVRTPLHTVDELDTLGAIFSQVLNGLMTAETEREVSNISANDVYILPDLHGLKAADFSNAYEAVPFGEDAADDHLEQLVALSMSESDFETHLASRSRVAPSIPRIDVINVRNVSFETELYLRSVMAWQEDQFLDIDRLELSISRVYSEGRFSRIQYDVEQSDEGTSLNFDVTSKPWGPTIVEAALRLSDSFNGDSNYLLSVETLTGDINESGAMWINRARIGLRTGLFSELYQPISDDHRYFVSPSIEYAAKNISLRTTVDQTLWRDQRGILGVDIGRAFSNRAEFRLGYEYGVADTRVKVGDVLVSGDGSFTISQLTLEYLRDTLDHPAFPREGLFLDAKISEPIDSLGADASATAYSLDIYKPLAVGKGSLILGLSVNGLSNDDSVPFQEPYSLGGITRLSGYQPDELFGRYTGLANIVYYRRIGGDESSLFGTPLYVGGSIEAGGVWINRDNISGESLQAAGSVFAGIDTPIGPIYFGYGQAEGGVRSLYLTVGSVMRRLPRR